MITEASPILNLLLAKGVGTKTLSDVLSKLVVLNVSPGDVAITELADILQLRDEMTTNLLAVQAQAESLAEELDQQGIRILIRGFGEYPKRLLNILGKNAPPVLFAKGNVALLDSKGVGFCGSRHASEKGIHVASESARLLGKRSVNVVSGYAKGVDLAAHCASLEGGGTTTIVLAEGILHFRPKREIKSLLNPENHVVVSEYTPWLPWAARQAMQRNQTIIGLSDAMIVIESGTSGGTFACAESALRLKHPLFVVEYAVPSESAGGNQQFLEQGAQALRGDRHGRPKLSRVYEALGLMSAANVADANEVSSSPEPRVSTPISNLQQPAEQLSEHPVDQSSYPKRLIEVDLPIARISAHARREKSIRHGHISTLHIWWARRPLAACRAVICASLWPDPADELCPTVFREATVVILNDFARRVNSARISEESRTLQETLSAESRGRWEAMAAGTLTLDPAESADMMTLRMALLDFIADFANWDNSTVPAYLETARRLTGVAHASLNEAQFRLPVSFATLSAHLAEEAKAKAEGSKVVFGGVGEWMEALDKQLAELPRPLVVDPFAGGGSIPLEALRVGADAFASDLNPVPVLLNKVVLEYIPKYGRGLADEVGKWGDWIKKEAEKELAKVYPKDLDGATPMAYLWARTVACEGPACGAEVPLIRSLWLVKKPNRSVALRLIPNPQSKRVDFDILTRQENEWISQTDSSLRLSLTSFSLDGTVKRGSATCPCCGYTTPVASVRKQFKLRRGGANDARMMCVVVTRETEQGRFYRLPTEMDLAAVLSASKFLQEAISNHQGQLTLVPIEPTPKGGGSGAGRAFSQRNYGMDTFGDLFTDRQLLSLTTLIRLSNQACAELRLHCDGEFANAVQVGLALAINRCADQTASLVVWHNIAEKVEHVFGRQALPIVWDFADRNPLSRIGWDGAIEWVRRVLEQPAGGKAGVGQAVPASATSHPLPNDSASLFATDPPYYDAIPYSDLSDFFYVWLKRSLPASLLSAFRNELTPKDDECIVDEVKGKDREYFERTMAKAMAEGRRILQPSGIGIVVFAHKSTAGWEAQLQAIIDAGWTITGSWPIDTEMATRLRAKGSAALASSVHLVCRPREDAGGTVTETVGEWRDVLGELPKRIHEWMPRLAAEGVVGADAIFACLGPALEVFSRYSRVEKANGDTATLREYLEFVWAAVSTEALSLIFKDADAAGLEPDARLTAMWLWTLGGGNTAGEQVGDGADETDDSGDDEDTGGKVAKLSGFTLEYDAARKIAQGLGVHLEQCQTLVEVKGDKARMLPVKERAEFLFGKSGSATSTQPGGKAAKKKAKQQSLFNEMVAEEPASNSATWGDLQGPTAGSTVLDRVHQSMILFAAGRGELLKRFLVEDGIGKDARFWRLAQSLSALYPKECEEKRWLDGVLSRKKGLGF